MKRVLKAVELAITDKGVMEILCPCSFGLEGGSA